MNSQARFAADNWMEPWDRLFSSLYLAEQAAAGHAADLVAHYAGIGNSELARFYAEMSREEQEHARLVKVIVQSNYSPPQNSIDVYAGKKCRCEGELNYLERAAIIHLVFEPSALAFMSYLTQNAYELFDRDFARSIRSSLSQIVLEESSHVKHGRAILEKQFRNISSSEIRKIKRSLSLHSKFITLGIDWFFQDWDQYQEIASDLVKRYDFSFTQVNRGLF